VEGIEHPGFAMLDIWELCSAYYLPRNDLNKRELYQMIETGGMSVGLLANDIRPSFEVACRQQTPTGSVQEEILSADADLHHSLEGQIGIVVAGSAGQKIRSAASVFALAAILSGLKATQKDDYPITIMTGHSIAEINLSPDPIQYTEIESPDYFLIISEDGLKKTSGWVKQLPASCKLLVEEGLEIPETRAEVLRIPFVSAAREVGRLCIGTIALAALLAETDLFSTKALQKAITRFQSGQVAAANMEAVSKGVQLCQEG